MFYYVLIFYRNVRKLFNVRAQLYTYNDNSNLNKLGSILMSVLIYPDS